MSSTTSVNVVAGVTSTLRPPLSGIYYTSVAIFNSLPITFSVQNGVNPNTLSSYQAQLFTLSSSGSPIALTAPPSSYPYGTLLGTLTAVWYDPDGSPGSFPVSLAPQTSSVVVTTTSPPVETQISIPSGSLVLPVGAVSVAIQLMIDQVVSGTIQSSFTVTGVQSGQVYATTALTSPPGAVGTFYSNVNIFGLNPLDAQLQIQLNFVGGGSSSNYLWTFSQSPIAQVAG